MNKIKLMKMLQAFVKEDVETAQHEFSGLCTEGSRGILKEAFDKVNGKKKDKDKAEADASVEKDEKDAKKED